MARPLSSIEESVQQLAQCQDPEQHSRLLADIDGAVRFLRHQADDLRDYAELDQGLQLHSEPFSVRDVCQQTRDLLYDELRKCINALVQREQIGTEIGATAKEEKAKDIDHILLDAKLNAAHGLSEKLAWEIHKYLIRSVRSGNRGVKQAPFMVLIGATMPSVLTEISFLSNDESAAYLATAEYRNQIADALFSSIVEYQTSLTPTDRLAANDN